MTPTALQALFDPDLILLDGMMPDPDEIEACRRLRTAGNSIQIPLRLRRRWAP